VAKTFTPETLADAFAKIEFTDARVYFLHVGKDIHEAIKKLCAWAGWTSSSVWGAEVTLDKKLPKGVIVFRYKRRKLPPEEERKKRNDWYDPPVFGRYRKRVTFRCGSVGR
jgi:hypothetical protein